MKNKIKKHKVIFAVLAGLLLLIVLIWASYFTMARTLFGFCPPGTVKGHYLPDGGSFCAPPVKPSIYEGRSCKIKSDCGKGFCLTTKDGSTGTCSDDLPAGLQYYFDENGTRQESFFVI